MRIGSLFAGIGGLDLACEWAGLGSPVWQVEIDPFCRAVLAKHWPTVQRYDDVRAVGSANIAPADVVVGGFPCQDLSVAGKRAGLGGARSGLWFEYLRILGELRPVGVIVENVSGLAGGALDAVASGLHGLGYTVDVARVAASDVGAPHQRIRHFIVAYADHMRQLQPRWGEPYVGGRSGYGGQAGHADRPGLEGRGLSGGRRSNERATRPAGSEGGDGPARPARPGVGRGADGLSAGLDGPGPGGAWPAPRGAPQGQWEPPRTAEGVPNRAARLKALGNAVCPQQGVVAAMRLRQLLEDR